MNPIIAQARRVIKLIYNLLKDRKSYALMNNTVSAIRVYYITFASGLTIGHHSLVARAK